MKSYTLFDGLRVALESESTATAAHFDAELLPHGADAGGERQEIFFRETAVLSGGSGAVGSPDRARLKFVKGAPQFTLDGDRMLVRAWNGARASLPLTMGDRTVVEFEPEMPPAFLFNTLFPPLLRRHLRREGKALLHASAAEVDGRAEVFCGWAHAGKTSSLLGTLRDGGRYLGDDKVVIDREGRIHPCLLRLNLFGYNFEQHPWLVKRAFRPARYHWLSWWNRRAQGALRRPWNKGPLRGSWESVEYLTKTGLHNRYRPEELEIPVADAPVPLGTFHVLAPLPELELDDLARRLRSVNDEEDFLQKRMQPAADFLHGAAPLFEGGADEERLIAEALANAGKIAYGSG